MKIRLLYQQDHQLRITEPITWIDEYGIDDTKGYYIALIKLYVHAMDHLIGLAEDDGLDRAAATRRIRLRGVFTPGRKESISHGRLPQCWRNEIPYPDGAEVRGVARHLLGIEPWPMRANGPEFLRNRRKN